MAQHGPPVAVVSLFWYNVNGCKRRGELMIRPISVSALPGYRINVVFSDGAQGAVDLSDLAGRGVFKAWKDERFFAGVYLGPGRQIRWSEEIELCPDAVYMRLTGKTPEELFPQLEHESSHARG